MSNLQNITFDEICIGQTASYSKTLTEDLLTLFAAVSGDINPVHLDAEYAANSMFGERVAHGSWTGSVVSAALAMEMPGPGTIFLRQSISFRKPVKVEDTITVNLEVTAKNAHKQIVLLNYKVTNQRGQVVAKGTAEVIAPSEKLVIPRPVLPQIHID